MVSGGPMRDSGKNTTWRKQVGEQAAQGNGNVYIPKGSSSGAIGQFARLHKKKFSGNSPVRPGSGMDTDLKGAASLAKKAQPVAKPMAKAVAPKVNPQSARAAAIQKRMV